MIYIELFLVYIKIGFFGFGGGYAMLSLVQQEVVTNHQWISNGELTDIIAISQMTPGPVAINSATYIGYTVTGTIWGALIATIAVCAPALTIMLLITRFYLKLNNNVYVQCVMESMKPVILGLIAAAALVLFNHETFIDWRSWAICGGCFIASILKMNPIILIILSGIVGIILYS